MYGMVLGGAWLLSVSETAIEVLHHPSETFEFDSVVKLVQQYGNASQQKLAEQYACTPNDTLKRQLIAVYQGHVVQSACVGCVSGGSDFSNCLCNIPVVSGDHSISACQPRFRESKLR